MLAALAQDKMRGGQSIPPFRARPALLDSPMINATLDYMKIHLSPDQEAHLAALAASVGRPADELVQEALAEWEQRQAERQPQRPKRTPAEAAARILELRKGNILPAGETIRCDGSGCLDSFRGGIS